MRPVLYEGVAADAQELCDLVNDCVVHAPDGIAQRIESWRSHEKFEWYVDFSVARANANGSGILVTEQKPYAWQMSVEKRDDLYVLRLL